MKKIKLLPVLLAAIALTGCANPGGAKLTTGNYQMGSENSIGLYRTGATDYLTTN